jgi:NhaA family Na+:H+ antiporter
MVLPAAIFLLVTAGSGHSRGWGIPMATDIAMAVGVLSLLGNRVAPSLKLFVLALAIVDDIGAILVIALVYSEHIHLGAVVVSLGILLAVALFRRVGVRWIGVYVALGVLLWFGLHEAGVHTTLVGVTMGLLTPTQPIHPGRADSPSLVEWLEHFLHPWSSFVVLPLFALANAGVPLSVDSLRDAASSTVAWGVLLGLVVGKTVGITVFTWLARRFRIAALPNGADWRGICGVAVLCGIGFTVSIFVTGLAYRDEATQNEAKIGILFASVTAAAVGSIVLATASRPRR